MQNGEKNRLYAWTQTSTFHFTVLAVLFWLGLYFGNYLTVYLQALGFSSSSIGYVNSAAAATGMLGNFVAGRLSDRRRTVKWLCFSMLILCAAAFLLYPLTPRIAIWGVSLALVWWPFACLFRSPACTLMENWIVRSSYSEEFNYGTVRAGGSIGSFLSSVLASTLVTALYQTMTQVKAVSATYLISGGILLLTAIYALTVRDVPFEQKKQINAGKLKFRRLLSNYYFASLLVFNFALNVFINPPFVFLPYILTESGIDSAKVGLIVGWEALLELPMLFLMNKLRKRLPLHVLLIMSSVLFAVTAAGQSMSHSMTMLMLCGTLFGFANSLNFSCGYHYIYCIAPIELRATAQTFYSIAGSLGIIAGNLAAGSLIEKMGTRPVYSLFAILTLAVAGAYTLSFIFGSRVLKKNVPNIVPDI